MNLANKLTLLRVFMIPIFLVFLLGNFVYEPLNRYMAISIFILASLTDALDGHIARSRNMITNFGKFMDPVADKLLVCSALIAMVELNLLPAFVVIIIIGRDFIIMAFRIIAADNNIVMAAGNIGKVKTALQMVMIIYLLFNFTTPTLVMFGNFLIAAVLVLTVASLVVYIYKNAHILK